VTRAAGDIAAEATAGDAPAQDAWAAVRAEDAIQFAPVEAPAAAPPPGWLTAFFSFLGDVLGAIARVLGLSWPVARWVLLALAVALLAWLLWRLLSPLLARERPPEAEGEDAPWTPERSAALALLEEADRLAAEGRYDEATHLLLRRSVGQIAAARPGWVEPSSTARELAMLPGLPEPAREAFATIAGRVERSLFALRSLAREDWQAARDAYARFALQPLADRA
jgi:hypothetical protein